MAQEEQRKIGEQGKNVEREGRENVGKENVRGQEQRNVGGRETQTGNVGGGRSPSQGQFQQGPRSQLGEQTPQTGKTGGDFECADCGGTFGSQMDLDNHNRSAGHGQ